MGTFRKIVDLVVEINSLITYPAVKLFRLITYPVYLVWKSWVIEKVKQSDAWISFPLLVWIRFHMDGIYWKQGAEMAQQALLVELERIGTSYGALVDRIVDPLSHRWICVNMSDLLAVDEDLRKEITTVCRPGNFIDCEPGQPSGAGIALEIDEAQAREWMKRGRLRFYHVPAGTEKWVLLGGDSQ